MKKWLNDFKKLKYKINKLQLANAKVFSAK